MSDTSLPTAAGPPSDLSGRRLGDYQLLRRLGRGAMAEVYLAQQVSLRRQVAVKILKPDLATDKLYVQRFHNEAMAAAALAHANIVQIHEVGRHDGFHYIAQEYVAGRNLGEMIQRGGPAEVKLAVLILRQVAAALHRAAEQGIVHRDIKPENILLARGGEVKVADFGLARILGGDGVNLTQVGVTLGTPLYMSPEQIEGRPLDARADIYSLGVTCYHMLAGQPPFDGETALAVAVRHLNKTPERLEHLRPDLPSELCRIVHKMLNKKPERRHASPRELLQDLRTLKIDGLDDDWAEQLENWTAAELSALSGARLEATERLNTLMQTSSLLTPRRPRYGRWALLGAACLLLGAALAAVFRPRPLLAEAEPTQVPQRETAWGQLYHAKMTDSEAAWRSVWEHFPDDQYAIQLAQRGLVRHYLWQTAEYNKAWPLLEDLATFSPAGSELRAFGIAGKAIVLGLRGRREEALAQFAQLTPEMIDQLDRRTRRTLGDVINRGRAAMSRDAALKLQRLQTSPENQLSSPEAVDKVPPDSSN